MTRMRAWLFAVLLLVPSLGLAQTVLSTTVLQSDIGPTTRRAIVAHGASITVGQVVFVFDDQPEAARVDVVSGTRLDLQRGYGSPARSHRAGALVYYGAASSFQSSDVNPGASCVGASVVPSINPQTGRVFQCVSSVWAQVLLGTTPTTGYGAVVQATSGTLTTPTLTTPTVTSPTVTDATIAAGALSGTFSGNPTFSGDPVMSGSLFVRERFDQALIVVEEDFSAQVLTDGAVNVVLGSPLGLIEYREEQAKTTSSWVQTAGVLDIRGDSVVDNNGVEIYVGDDDNTATGRILAQTSGACFTVNFSVALIAGTDQFVIGWRQNAAFVGDNVYTGYADWSVVGLTNVDGSVFALHEVASGGTLSDDSGTNAADAGTYTLQSCIGTDGIPTASLDGTAITLTNGGTAHTSGTWMNPFISYLASAGAVDAGITINWMALTPLS